MEQAKLKLWRFVVGVFAIELITQAAPIGSVGLVFGSIFWAILTYATNKNASRDLPTLQQLLADLKGPADRSTTAECLICRDAYTSPLQLPCSHIYCRDCIRAWFEREQNRCPQCQRPLFQFGRTFSALTVQIMFCGIVVFTSSNLLGLVLLYSRRSKAGSGIFEKAVTMSTLGVDLYVGLAIVALAWQAVKIDGANWWRCFAGREESNINVIIGTLLMVISCLIFWQTVLWVL